LQAGNIDVMLTQSYQAAATLERSGFTVLKNWQSQAGMAMTNTAPDVGGKQNPVSNIHARKALAYATDQQALADNLGPGSSPKSPIPSAQVGPSRRSDRLSRP
jgi:ABC-type transport system substrate-binding protein